jgi:hypothetical protein
MQNVGALWRLGEHCRDVVTWNAAVLGHVKCSQGQNALKLFGQMQQVTESLAIIHLCNYATRLCYFCGGAECVCQCGCAQRGQVCFHQQVVECGWDSHVFVGSALADLYMKCGSMEDAWIVFEIMPSQNVVTLTAILGGCAMHGHDNEALKHFEHV